MSLFLDTLRTRVLFFDGSMGTQVQARELTADDFGGKRWEGCIDYVSLTGPALSADTVPRTSIAQII